MSDITGTGLTLFGKHEGRIGDALQRASFGWPAG